MCICAYVCIHVRVHMHVGVRVQQWCLSLPLSNLYFETESLIEHGGHRWAGMDKQQAWASCCLSEPRHPDVLGASPLGSQRTQVSCCLCHPAPHLLHPTTPVTRVSVISGMQMSQRTPHHTPLGSQWAQASCYLRCVHSEQLLAWALGYHTPDGILINTIDKNK